MHLEHSRFPDTYKQYSRKKIQLIIGFFLILVFVFLLSLSLGSVKISVSDLLKVYTGDSPSKRNEIIIWNIRLPEALVAVVSGIGLAVSGVVIQAILKNPLGSPFTLGISNAAAFGAAFSVIFLGSGVMQSHSNASISIHNPYTTTACAFIFSLLTSFVIMLVSKTKKAAPEIIVLTGIALGALFTAGTMFLQYFADDMQLAAMVFWTFGDLSRASWAELQFIFVILIFSLFYFFYNRWNYNALLAGDETAQSIGVNVVKIRITGMVIACLLTATIVSFLGVIGFVGLVCPHIARKIIGDDHRYLIPFTALTGAILMLCASAAGRCLLAPHSLPVAILTSFLGAPVFIYLLITRSKK